MPAEMDNDGELDSAAPPGVAGVAQAAILLAAVTLPVMGVISLVPVLPELHRHFADVPGADYLVPVALTIPGMCIALLSPFTGMLADRFGRRGLLLTALAFYGLFGVAPLLLDNLILIIATRFGLGVAEAAIMTVTTTLTGDYFKEDERQKWVAAQAVAGSLAATLLFLAGGALGTLGWQGPFFLYALAVPVFFGAAKWLWEPSAARRPGRDDVDRSAFPWRAMVPVCAVTLACSVAFYAGPLQLGVRLSDLGITSASTIGIMAGLSSLGVPVGAFAFRRLRAPRVAAILTTVLLLIGIGLVVIGLTSTLPLIGFAMFVAQVGCGILMPCLITWCLAQLPFEHRGRGSGLWTSAFFLGQFITPLVMAGLADQHRGMAFAYLAVGAACLLAAIGAALSNRRAPAPSF